MDKKETWTWEELLAIKSGTILKDWFDGGVRCIIMRGPFSLCAYVGIPADHPLANYDYDLLPIHCHGGLTYSGIGDKIRPEGWFWYGWDYAHCGDFPFYNAKDPKYYDSKDKKWLVEDVYKDMQDAVFEFKLLARLAELVHNKARNKK